MDWMYKNSTDTVDREEYLLGKAIDKNFESQLSGSFNELDKDITPASIFTNAGSNLQVDVLRKLKEDPLEQIRQKELETRKQLLKNPVKLKKLQNMLKANRDKQEMILKKKAKKKKKKHKSSEKSIDDLLTSKFLQLKEKLGGKHLAELGKMDGEHLRGNRDLSEKKIISNKRNKKKQSKRESSSSSDSSSSSSSEEENSSSDNAKKDGRTKVEKYGTSPSWKTGRDECKPYRKKYGLEVKDRGDRRGPIEPSVPSSSKPYLIKKITEKKDSSLPDKRFKKRLTEEEKAQKLKEMSENVAWRSQLTTKNIKRYKEEQKKEKETNEKDFDDGFFRRQMALATSHTTVQQRIKSNVNNIQRSERDMNEHFARR